MSHLITPVPSFPSTIIGFGEPGPEVVSPEITMDMRCYRAQSDSMLFYEPGPSDFIPSIDNKGLVNIDSELVANLVNDFKTLGSIMHDMAGLTALDWYRGNYYKYPAKIPPGFLQRIAIREPNPTCSTVYANNQFIYKPNMTPQQAVGWLRGMQHIGLDTIAWIKDAAIHIALSDGKTGWHVTREHIMQLPHPYHMDMEKIWKVIDQVQTDKQNSLKLVPFDPTNPKTWYSPRYADANPNDPIPFILKTTFLPKDQALINSIQEDSHAFYDMTHLPTLKPSDLDSCSTLSSEEDLTLPSPPIQHITPSPTPSSLFLPNPNLVQAVAGYAQAQIAEADDEVSNMDLCHTSEDETSDDELYTGPQFGCEYPDGWRIHNLKFGDRCSPSCTEGEREEENALKGRARQEETSHQDFTNKKIIAFEIQGLSSNEYSFEGSFKLTSNLNSSNWI